MKLQHATDETYLEFLKKEVFFTETKWPHFNLLLNDVLELSELYDSDGMVVSFERNLLYDSFSLFAPFFKKTDYYSFDLTPEHAKLRGAYNKKLLKNNPCHGVSYKEIKRDELEMYKGKADLILVPNLIHHYPNQRELFNSISSTLKPGGRAYIFEPLIRELHQEPDDYLRYTPYGLELQCIESGLDVVSTKREGGAFSAITYCWTQALMYLPEELKEKYEGWFYNEHFPMLLELDDKYKENLDKRHSSFPMAFSVLAQKQVN